MTKYLVRQTDTDTTTLSTGVVNIIMGKARSGKSFTLRECVEGFLSKNGELKGRIVICDSSLMVRGGHWDRAKELAAKHPGVELVWRTVLTTNVTGDLEDDTLAVFVDNTEGNLALMGNGVHLSDFVMNHPDVLLLTTRMSQTPLRLRKMLETRINPSFKPQADIA